MSGKVSVPNWLGIANHAVILIATKTKEVAFSDWAKRVS